MEASASGNKTPRREPPTIIGTSAPMQRIRDLVLRLGSCDSTVLLCGESGVGKGLVARAIHHGSARAAAPFVTVNCAALAESLLESELFGHEKGAFTGAERQRAGRFELAQGGTVFLDEIGDLPLSTQILLLRVLQERCFERVGGSETIAVDVRVVAATHRDLLELVAAGRFREDLFYRLAVVPVEVPPLRARPCDIPLLAAHFIERHGRAGARLSDAALSALTAYPWPGNVRELENCIEHALLFADTEQVELTNLPPAVRAGESVGQRARAGLQATLDRVERELLVDALRGSRGNLSAAARLLQVSERVMGLRVRKHGLDPREFRSTGSKGSPPGL